MPFDRPYTDEERERHIQTIKENCMQAYALGFDDYLAENECKIDFIDLAWNPTVKAYYEWLE